MFIDQYKFEINAKDDKISRNEHVETFLLQEDDQKYLNDLHQYKYGIGKRLSNLFYDTFLIKIG